MAEHISKQFDLELETIRTRVLQMGGLVEAQMIAAIEALLASDLNALEQVIRDDALVNAMEVSLDEECQHIIARRQPAASDLRMVMTVIKIITDLERIGDEAQKVARMGKLILTGDRIHTPVSAKFKMADIAMAMVRRALDAFARLDVAGALDVARQDRTLDDEFDANFRQLVTFMMEDPRTISMSIDTIFMCKAIERIGDHAKNISEYVVYMVKGKDIRHSTLEDMEGMSV